MLTALLALAAFAALPPDVEHAHVWGRLGGPEDCVPAATLTSLTLLGLRDPRRSIPEDLLATRLALGGELTGGVSLDGVPAVVAAHGGGAWRLAGLPTLRDVRLQVELGRVVLLRGYTRQARDRQLRTAHVIAVAGYDLDEPASPWIVSDPGAREPRRRSRQWLLEFWDKRTAVTVAAPVPQAAAPRTAARSGVLGAPIVAAFAACLLLLARELQSRWTCQEISFERHSPKPEARSPKPPSPRT